MIISVPKILKAGDVVTFLNEVEIIFTMKNKMQPNVVLDLSKIKQTSVLGVLLIYKLIDFTYMHFCFKKPELATNKYVEEIWYRYGFTSLIQTYISNKDITEKAYKNLSIKIEDRFIIAPQPLLRKDNYSNIVLKEKFLPNIENYYRNNNKVISMIFLCLSEVLLNFWEHAVEDTKSILVAEGNKSQIEIACADTGNGIISTLGQSESYKSTHKTDIISSSVKKGVTSKKMTNHMGYGLWILDKITTLTKGRLHLYSEGAYYKNDFGVITKGVCGFWQGTIIYLSLPLLNPQTLCDIEKNSNCELKINWK